MANNPPELTCEAKAAIRKYTISLFTIPSIFIAAGSGIGGYIIKDVAYKSGYEDAYKAALSKITTASEEVVAVKTNAKITLDSVQELVKISRDKINSAVDEATKASAMAEAAAKDADAQISGNYEKIGEIIAASGAFQKEAASVNVEGVRAIKADVDQLIHDMKTKISMEQIYSSYNIMFKPVNQECPDNTWANSRSLIYVPRSEVSAFDKKTTVDPFPVLAQNPNTDWSVIFMKLCMK